LEFFNLIHPEIALGALPTILKGLLITLLVTLLCGIFSLTLGVLVAFGRKSRVEFFGSRSEPMFRFLDQRPFCFS